MTSSTLDGKCQELQVEDGDEDQSRQLSACAAWIQDQEEDADDLENFVMEQVIKTHKHKNTQKKIIQNKTREKKERKKKKPEIKPVNSLMYSIS